MYGFGNADFFVCVINSFYATFKQTLVSAACRVHGTRCAWVCLASIETPCLVQLIKQSQQQRPDILYCCICLYLHGLHLFINYVSIYL